MAARRRKAEAPQAPAGDAPAELSHEVTRLRECVELLREALQNVPRADEFQPLADHLYELAQTTPKLVKSLQSMPQVVGPLEDGVRRWSRSWSSCRAPRTTSRWSGRCASSRASRRRSSSSSRS